jgi:hypothetical protein
MDLTQVSFTKSDLNCLKEAEAIFLLQFGGVLQEISMLHKLMVASSQGEAETIERKSKNYLTMYFFRLLAATCHEVWKLLNHRKYKGLLSEYETTLEPAVQSVFRELKQYFSNPQNTCTRIRNKFSYHYDYGKICSAYQQWPRDEKLEIYLSQSHANCLYSASDIFTNIAMLSATDLGEIQSKLPTLLDEVLQAARWFIDLLGNLLGQILSKAKQQGALNSEKVTISEPPRLEDMRLSYFITER